MKYQACLFKRSKDATWEFGIAQLKHFNISDVNWIVDERGLLVSDIWNYKLINNPLSFIDSSYRD